MSEINQATSEHKNMTEIAVQFLLDHLQHHGDVVTYRQIESELGWNVKYDKPAYFAMWEARRRCTLLDDPFLVESIRGYGYKRIRMGMGGHLKANQLLEKNRRNSKSAIDYAQKGVTHAESDEEVFASRAQILIHSKILSNSHADEYRRQYSHVSNGAQPERKPVSLRDALRYPVSGK